MIPHSKLKFPRFAAVPALAILTTLVPIIGGAVTAAPAHAVASNWQKIHVAVKPTSVTIDFVATRTYGPVYVIIGTGLDPVQSQVARVILPKQPNGTKYTTTIGGLTQKTGYSFRLATPLIAAYTDITSIVTPAEPLVFSNVVGYADNVNGVVGFNYPGDGPVTVTFATNTDFESPWARKVVLTHPAYAHRWSAVHQLNAGTGYAFRVSAPNTPNYVDIWSINTKKRTVKVNYTSLYVVNDGDMWPYGCGDFALTHREINPVANANIDRTMIVGQCLNDGDGFSLTSTGALATGTYNDVKDNSFRTWFYAWDDDRTVYTGEGDHLSYTDTDYGDLGWGEYRLDITKPGTTPFAVHVTGDRYGNNVDVWAYGNAVVSFS